MTRIPLDSIRLDGGTQPRAKLYQERVDEYAEFLATGITFPPVEACYDGQSYWLWDGFHRVQACRVAGLEDIDVNVTPGTQADAHAGPGAWEDNPLLTEASSPARSAGRGWS
jgi:hypothetical protein